MLFGRQSVSPHNINCELITFFDFQELKKAILDQMTAEAKKEKLRSFEQVWAVHYFFIHYVLRRTCGFFKMCGT